MSAAITAALDQIAGDLRKARWVNDEKKVAHLEARRQALIAEQAAETEQSLAVSAEFERQHAPRIRALAFPSGETGFRCRTCQKLLHAREHGQCYGCRAADL